ncbi:hypothetical protein JCM10213v2_002152 [Rhodosporidiobolus nylandii]
MRVWGVWLLRWPQRLERFAQRLLSPVPSIPRCRSTLDLSKMPTKRGTYYRIPGLPPPSTASASSPTSSSRRYWRPPKRATLLLVLAAGAMMWVLADRVRTGRYGERVGGGVAGGGRGEESKQGLGEVLLGQQDAAANPGIEATEQVQLVFAPRRPCNALTTTVHTLPFLSSSRLAAYNPFRHPPTHYWLSPSPPLPLHASLETRLKEFLSSPLAAPDVWARFNRQTCGNPSVRRNRNRVHVEAGRETWEGMGVERVRAIREELAGVLREAEASGRLEEYKKKGRKGTRGIVWTAGNADTFDRVLVTLRLLRNSYHCTLPATIFHFPSESPTPSQLESFASLNASILPLSLSKDSQPGRTKSFHLKGAALVQAECDECLMLDSDSVPVRDPSGLWDSPEFREMGVVLWPDYFKDQPENAIWSILGVQCRDEWTAEAGQLLIRKSQHLDVLLLVEHMLKDWHFWFKLSDGDKDCFRYALLLLRKRWAVPSLPLSPASWRETDVLGPDNEGRFAGHTMLQYGLASEEGGERGRAMFAHANLLKRVVSTDIQQGNTWGRTLHLRLPSTSSSRTVPSSSAASASSASPSPSPFILQADHLANVSPFTGLGLPASSSPFSAAVEDVPLWVRQRALLSRGLRMSFWDGHRGVAYVLATETSWEDELRSLSVSSPEGEGEGKPWEREDMDEQEWREWGDWVEREREAQCTVEKDVELPELPLRGGAEDGGDAAMSGGRTTEFLRSALLSSSSRSPTSPAANLAALDGDSPPPLDIGEGEGAAGWVEIALWEDDPDLRDFERLYYEVGGGKAGSVGFR